jgi:hypothetical protein
VVGGGAAAGGCCGAAGGGGMSNAWNKPLISAVVQVSKSDSKSGVHATTFAQVRPRPEILVTQHRAGRGRSGGRGRMVCGKTQGRGRMDCIKAEGQGAGSGRTGTHTKTDLAENGLWGMCGVVRTTAASRLCGGRGL